jgi:hypothetical protein
MSIKIGLFSPIITYQPNNALWLPNYLDYFRSSKQEISSCGSVLVLSETSILESVYTTKAAVIASTRDVHLI